MLVPCPQYEPLRISTNPLTIFAFIDFETVCFDSHDISKPYSSSLLTELDDDDTSTIAAKPRKEHLDRIVKVVRTKLDVALFGIDVIIEKSTGRYAIIDINLFPGMRCPAIMQLFTKHTNS